MQKTTNGKSDKSQESSTATIVKKLSQNNKGQPPKMTTDPTELVELLTKSIAPNAIPSMEIVSSESEESVE